jgi:hypothetical protein
MCPQPENCHATLGWLQLKRIETGSNPSNWFTLEDLRIWTAYNDQETVLIDMIHIFMFCSPKLAFQLLKFESNINKFLVNSSERICVNISGKWKFDVKNCSYINHEHDNSSQRSKSEVIDLRGASSAPHNCSCIILQAGKLKTVHARSTSHMKETCLVQTSNLPTALHSVRIGTRRPVPFALLSFGPLRERSAHSQVKSTCRPMGQIWAQICSGVLSV